MKPLMEAAAALPFPVIDLGQLDRRVGSRSIAVHDIGKACEELGYFQVVNHGISKSIMKGALDAEADFFGLEEQQRAELASEDVKKPVRYSTRSPEGFEEPRHFLKQYAHPLNRWIHLWPLHPHDYREKMGRYALEVRKVALQLMDAILESLGLGQAYLKEELEDGMQVMTVNSYPAGSSAGGGDGDPTIGMAPHSDFGCITILLQSCPGLQMAADGHGATWRDVPTVPPTLHVHIGDHLEVLSNGRYKSVLHRVVLVPSKCRGSVASIHGFSMETKVGVAEGLVDEQHPMGYRASSFRDFLDYTSAATDVSKGASFIDSLRVPRT